MSLCKFHSTFCHFLQVQTLVFRRWSERRIKAELSSALLKPCPSNVNYSKGETIKDSFLPLSLSHWYHWLCRPNPVKLTPCAIKKEHTHTHTHTHTQKYLKLNPPNWTSFGWQPNSCDLSYPKILNCGTWHGGQNLQNKFKKSHPQRCQLDLNLCPESWRLLHQIQSCLAWLVVIMVSLGSDWHHDKLCRCYGVPDLLQVPSLCSSGWVLNR